MTPIRGEVPEVVIEEARWQTVGIAALAERACAAALGAAGYGVDTAGVAVLACDDARIAALNGEFRGKSGPTNVLSWPSAERGAGAEGGAPAAASGELGDIAIAWETCVREAREQGKPVATHVTHLLVHGTLHLLGFDHTRPGDAALMQGREREALARLGLPDPYSADWAL